jgi:hypothetical protein
MGNPIPAIASLNLSSLPVGSSNPLSIYILGSNFLPSSTIQVNGANRLTGHMDSSELMFQLTVADQATPGNLSITVVNPPPNGGTSAPAILTLTAPVGTPRITRVLPAQFTGGSPATSMQVIGTNLAPGEVVQWNGVNLAIGFGYSPTNGYYLVVTVSANLLNTSGSASVTVDNASVTPSISNAISVPIVNPPPPTLSSLSTSLVPINTATTITLYGTSFGPSF